MPCVRAEPGDGLADIAPGAPARALVPVVNAGSDFWPHFTASPEFADGKPDPLNRWTRRVVSAIAASLGAGAVFPFDGPPFLPFQQWALRTGTVSPSPLGVLAHRTWGPWFAFRGALVFGDAFEPEPTAREPGGGPCEACAEKPCLDACPAGALGRTHGYRPAVCRSFVAADGAASCGARGCLVRHACPVGRDFAYRPEQARFHMRAFVAAGPRE